MTFLNPKLPFVLLLPGIFLFVLGVGNISVGLYKGRQYEQVLGELAGFQPSQAKVKNSVLSRLYSSTSSFDLLAQRRQRVQSRLEFYRFTVSGGKVILSLSTLFILGAVLAKLRCGQNQSFFSLNES